MIDNKDFPFWLLNLEKEELSFIKNFILSSGSLKALSKEYHVSYPTVRLRLNNLIQKIEMAESSDVENSFISYVKNLTIDDLISTEAAKLIINKYKKEE